MSTCNEPTNLWRLVAGVVFILFWVLMHAGLFYLIAAGGVLSDLLLGIVRSILLPGTAQSTEPENFLWVSALKTGFILSGLSGIPFGMSFFLVSKRKLLGLCFAALFFLGLLAFAFSVFQLLSGLVGDFAG